MPNVTGAHVGATVDAMTTAPTGGPHRCDTLDRVSSVLADAVIDDAEAGVYRANRSIFTDEEIFELEMKHIFEGNWVYLAHESQLPNPGDYFTTYIGRQPVVITRDRDGELNCAGQRLRAPRRDDLPAQDGQPDRRSPARSTAGRSATTASCSRSRTPTAPATREPSTATASHNMTKVGAVRQLPRLPVRQPQRRRRAARRAPRRRRQGHRHDRRPVARGPRGAARLVDLHLRRQLEGAGRERRRRLSRHRDALELRRHHRRRSTGESRSTRPRR